MLGPIVVATAMLAAWQPGTSLPSLPSRPACATRLAAVTASGADSASASQLLLHDDAEEELCGSVVPTPTPPRIAADRLIGTDKPTVWTEFGDIARETGALNLGQGFPDWAPPEFVVEQAHAALDAGVHQYTRPAGHPPLVEVLARRYSDHLE